MSDKFYVAYDSDWRLWKIMQSNIDEENGLTYDTTIANSFTYGYAEQITSLLNKYMDQFSIYNTGYPIYLKEVGDEQ